MGNPEGETLHPSLAEAVDECKTLTRAAELVGATSPKESISQIDFDPDTIEDFVDDLKPSRSELDEAIEDARQALHELRNGSDGEASDEAIAEAERELAELEKERQELAVLINELNGLPDKMDDIARNAANDIIDEADAASTPAKLVLTGSDKEIEFYESLTDTTVEDAVQQACQDIADICSDAQDELDDLAQAFRSLSGEEDGSGDRGSGPGGGIGRGEDEDDADRGSGDPNDTEDDDDRGSGPGGGIGRGEDEDDADRGSGDPNDTEDDTDRGSGPGGGTGDRGSGGANDTD